MFVAIWKRKSFLVLILFGFLIYPNFTHVAGCKPNEKEATLCPSSMQMVVTHWKKIMKVDPKEGMIKSPNEGEEPNVTLSGKKVDGILDDNKTDTSTMDGVIGILALQTKIIYLMWSVMLITFFILFLLTLMLLVIFIGRWRLEIFLNVR
ncbi:hypothetical protein Ocin01_08485 [Orchesella cincta]|uniref:Uncharacterized protein n=1 Tax=Orchesella cincta TaxID=48709 RepID=A0A1D2MZF4_ORCCI|nr:hypothetical protein Ocin01_08485 [Orchesella cincta]